MKIFRKLFLLVPLALSLASCSGPKSPAGTYSFQLGSDSGTHAGIHLKLTDDEATIDTSEESSEESSEEQIEAKKFELKFDIGASSAGGVLGVLTHLDTVIQYIEDETGKEAPPSIDDIVKNVENIIKDKGESDVPFTIPGYYYFKEATNVTSGKPETRLMMGIDFNLIKDMPIQLPAELVEMVMYAIYTPDTINVIVPVSLQDLLFQIYWYGYRIAGIDSLTNPVDLHEENPYIKHHDVGTHPTEDDVAVIQEYQKGREEQYVAGELTDEEYEKGEFVYNSYHDYHTLTMGLSKLSEKKNNGK